MTQAIERDPIYRCRRFQTETIELCVRWYITYWLSYRDLVAMMAERGVVVSHTTIMRWVLRYVPEFEKRWTRYARRVNSSWRVDETAVSVRGGRHYLYRAVDKHGKSVDFLLRADRGMDAAQALFRRAVATHRPRWPRNVNLDGNAASHRALRLLGQEDSRWQSVVVRSCRYLNNIVEQDHRAIKRRCSSMLGLKSFRTAAITFAGIELANRIRKRQFSFGRGGQRSNWSLKQLWNRALACDANALDRQCTRTEAATLRAISRRRTCRGVSVPVNTAQPGTILKSGHSNRSSVAGYELQHATHAHASSSPAPSFALHQPVPLLRRPHRQSVGAPAGSHSIASGPS